MESQGASYLIVDDDPRLARSIGRLLYGVGECVVAHSVRDAAAKLDSSARWVGFVVDLRLDDGSGADLLEQIRARHPDVPRALMTGYVDEPGADECAAALGCRFLPKPLNGADLAPFVIEVVLYALGADPSLHAAMGALAQRHDLSTRQVQVLTLCAMGETPESIQRRLGIEQKACETLGQALAAKLGVRSFEEACARVRAHRT